MNDKRLDRRRKYYMVLDCETATLPCASGLDADAKKNVAIAKPLIYDLGWQVIDNKGRVYRRKKFLITEIFSVPEIFNTAYYASKRPIYLERLASGEIELTTWSKAVAEMEADLAEVEAVGAYNSMFDFKKAIPFTELYLQKLYSPDFYDWYDYQRGLCDKIARGIKPTNERTFEPDLFRFRGKAYPLFDVWGLSCEYILNCDDYKRMCLDEGWTTASGKYFKTSAETAFRFFSEVLDFEEAHMAIDDAEIESQLFAEIHRRSKGKWEMGIIYFPFRILGKVENFDY